MTTINDPIQLRGLAAMLGQLICPKPGTDVADASARVAALYPWMPATDRAAVAKAFAGITFWNFLRGIVAQLATLERDLGECKTAVNAWLKLDAGEVIRIAESDGTLTGDGAGISFVFLLNQVSSLANELTVSSASPDIREGVLGEVRNAAANGAEGDAVSAIERIRLFAQVFATLATNVNDLANSAEAEVNNGQ